MKWLRAARHPMTLYMPFKSLMGPMLVMAAIFSGLASMPRSETMNPKSMPWGTPKTHFSGLSFTPFAFRLETSECHFKVGKEVGGFPCLDYDVIDVGFDRPANVFSEHMVHAPLVRRARIPQAERHGDTAVHAEGCDERSRELVGLLHPDLVIPGVGIEERQGFAPSSGIHDLIDARQRVGNLRTCFV
jgi:hypothetical protein